jgi:hypothetical protein
MNIGSHLLKVSANKLISPHSSDGVVLKKIVYLCIAKIPGDINNDCLVDFEDFAIMASNWL